MLKIILLGAPGSGKGTQADLLAKRFSMYHLSTGELLRQAILNNTELGLQAKMAIDSGQLVPNNIIINLVKHQIMKVKDNCGLIFDGFPRNLLQVEMLDLEGILIDWIIYLKVTDQVVINRLTGRRYHPKSGRVYHIEYNPPKLTGLDDFTGEPLIVRSDDQESVIRDRLSIYHKNNAEVIDWYKTHFPKKFVEIDATIPFNQVFEEITHIIKK